MKQILSVLDTGAVPNLVHEENIPLPWSSYVNQIKNNVLTGVSNHELNSVGLIILHTGLRCLRVRLWFGVVVKISVPVLLDTSYIGSFVRVNEQRLALVLVNL